MVQAGALRQIQIQIQIQAPVRLVLTELFEDSGRTTVTTTVRYATPEGRDAVLHYPIGARRGRVG